MRKIALLDPEKVGKDQNRVVGGRSSVSMRLSALSLKFRVFENLPMEKPRFFLNADILNEVGE